MLKKKIEEIYTYTLQAGVSETKTHINELQKILCKWIPSRQPVEWGGKLPNPFEKHNQSKNNVVR